MFLPTRKENLNVVIYSKVTLCITYSLQHVTLCLILMDLCPFLLVLPFDILKFKNTGSKPRKVGRSFGKPRVTSLQKNHRQAYR